MRYSFLILYALLFMNCNTGKLNIIISLPSVLNEVSGIETRKKDQLFWMVNDSGNKPILFGLDSTGKIIKALKVKAKNRDWEDLTTDSEGNIYIGNFGNNDNQSKNLSVLKITAKDLDKNKESVKPKVINFSYPEQKKFPPKSKNKHFDCEAFFYFKDALYLFTKSRNPKEKGKTNVYKLPTKQGKHKAKLISSFNTCEQSMCWVTSADINDNGTKMALLTENSVFVFSNFEDDDFFNSEFKRYKFEHSSQKESVAFKNDSTLYIADEYNGLKGRNLYELKID